MNIPTRSILVMVLMAMSLTASAAEPGAQATLDAPDPEAPKAGWIRVQLAPEADGGFGMTDTPERREKMLGLLGDESLQAKVAAKWERHTEWSGMQRWEHLTKEIQAQYKMR